MLSGHGAEQVNASALERGYAFSHEKLYPILKDKTVLDSNGKPLPEFSAYFEDKPNAEGKWVLKKDQHEVVQAGKNFYAVDKSVTVIDFSITKTVLQMMIVALVMLLVFTSVASAYKRNAGKAPSGFQAIVEPIIVFVRDEIAKPNLHGKHEPFVPYLLTLFFFIWFSNIFGLTPFNSNISGNISITVALATLTFIITQFNGTKDYWGHIFWFPGVPLPVKFIMLPVEVVGLFTRPFSLTVRLFANIAAGHFMVLALICLIFLMADNGKNPGAAFGIAPLSLVFGLFIMTLEVLVAAIQAYVFTLLSSVFIGMAMESHSHDHAHDAHH
jgi:F-type H+-transporting ATPase subunit a